MAPPASTIVFANYDLLEDILLHLPLRHLLLSKRVCKQWESTQQTSVRVRKALFLEPFHAQKIYYPSASKPHWYLVPERNELALEGLLSEEDLGEDDSSHQEQYNVSYPVVPTPKIPGSGSSSGSSDCSSGSGGSDVTICNISMDKHYMRGTASAPQQQTTAKKPPTDNKMLVSRIVSGPFLNPFAELFRKSNPFVPPERNKPTNPITHPSPSLLGWCPRHLSPSP